MGNVLTKAAAMNIAIQWFMFLLTYYNRTEKFFDITWSVTFVLLLLYTLKSGGRFFPRQVIQSGLVGTWAARLGLFLLFRILRDGKDARFNKVKENPKLFLFYWTVQGRLCALIAWFLTMLTCFIRFVGVGDSTSYHDPEHQACRRRTHQQGLCWMDHLAGWSPPGGHS